MTVGEYMVLHHILRSCFEFSIFSIERALKLFEIAFEGVSLGFKLGDGVPVVGTHGLKLEDGVVVVAKLFSQPVGGGGGVATHGVEGGKVLVGGAEEYGADGS